MAEFNPYKLEEEKWTPNNVYEILPPNAVSWSDYEFGQGTDNVDQEAANKSLIDGFVDFFKDLFGTAGKILGGAVELGGAVLGGFVNGVVSLIGGIANAIGSIFGGGSGESPNLPLFNPIKTNLEAAIQPQRDKINESLQKTEEILAEQAVLRSQMDESLQDMRDARDRANEAIEKSGQFIAEAQAASAAAEAARQTLETYNTALNKRITSEFNSAVGRADTAVEKADGLISDLDSFKQQHQRDIDSAQNQAIRANTEALKALGKKALGASLVPYKTPSTQEVKDYAAGKLDYDPWADPEYFNAGHLIWTNSRGRVARANPGQGTKGFTGSYVSVDSSIEYRVKFHTYSNGSGSRLYINMFDQEGNPAIASTPFAESDNSGSGDLVNGLELPAGVKYWSGVIKFNSGVTHVRLGNFGWNWGRGVQGYTQEFGGLEIVPNIPDANVVNELQDNAIRKNTEVGSANKKAIEALKDGLNAAIELGEVNQIVGNLRDDLSKEIDKRSALQEKIDALQTEMIPRTIVSDDRVTYDDYVELSGTKVTAKGTWAGQVAVTYIKSAYTSNGSVYETRVTRKSVPDGSTRSWTFSQGVERVDYWVYQGSQRTILLKNTGAYITGSSLSKGTWSVLATHKVGKTYGTGKIEWRANLLYADRNATYRFKIEVNGVNVKEVAWTNIGPLTPLGDGQRTLKFEHEFNLPDDATVGILGYISGGGSQQAKVTLLQGTLVYVQDTAREG